MKIIELEQGTPAWHHFRGKGIGGSDAPIIVGDSPWNDPFTLWAQKCGYLQRELPNEFQKRSMERGQQLEPVVRAKYEAQVGKKFPAIVAINEQHEWLRCSLDGWNAESKQILEIKCPNKVDHGKAAKGLVPDKYKAQLAHQFLVTGAESAVYVSYYNDEMPLAVVHVQPDHAYNKMVFEKLEKFWRCIETKTPPEFTLADLHKIFLAVAKNYESLSNSFGVLKLMMQTASEKEML
jgi:putative phage-type endonuclease